MRFLAASQRLLVQFSVVWLLFSTNQGGSCFTPNNRPSRLIFDDGSPAYDKSNDGNNLGIEDDCVASPDSSKIYQSLQSRMKDLSDNIGRRYVTRTQAGFLNIHQEPGDPFDTDNIIGKLSEGDIVTSTGPNRGPWIPHDGGGWSISVYQGFVWLEALKE